MAGQITTKRYKFAARVDVDELEIVQLTPDKYAIVWEADSFMYKYGDTRIVTCTGYGEQLTGGTIEHWCDGELGGLDAARLTPSSFIVVGVDKAGTHFGAGDAFARVITVSDDKCTVNTAYKLPFNSLGTTAYNVQVTAFSGGTRAHFALVYARNRNKIYHIGADVSDTTITCTESGTLNLTGYAYYNICFETLDENQGKMTLSEGYNIGGGDARSFVINDDHTYGSATAMSASDIPYWVASTPLHSSGFCVAYEGDNDLHIDYCTVASGSNTVNMQSGVTGPLTWCGFGNAPSSGIDETHFPFVYTSGTTKYLILDIATVTPGATGAVEINDYFRYDSIDSTNIYDPAIELLDPSRAAVAYSRGWEAYTVIVQVGPLDASGSCDLVITGSEGTMWVNDTDFYICGPLVESSGIDLFMQAGSSSGASIDLYMQVDSCVTGMLQPQNVRFYHKLDNIWETKRNTPWTDYGDVLDGVPSFETVSGLIVSGYHSTSNQGSRIGKTGYGSLEDCTKFTICFWFNNAYADSPGDPVVYVGYGDAPNDITADNGWSTKFYDIETSSPYIHSRLQISGVSCPAPNIYYPSGQHPTFMVLEAEYIEASGTWFTRASINGSGWSESYDTTVADLPDSVGEYAMIAFWVAEGADPDELQYLDEVALWANSGSFTNQELEKLYLLGAVFELPLCQYSDIFEGTTSGECNLYVGGYTNISGQADIFIHGHQELSDDTTSLYIGGYISISGDVDLYISSYDTLDDDADLFIWGHLPTSGDIDLYVGGKTQQSWQVDLYLAGLDTSTSGVDLYLGGKTSISGEIDLYIGGLDISTDEVDLYIYGLDTQVSGIDLYIGGYIQTSDDTDLYIFGHQSISGDVPLYLYGHTSISGDTDLFILCHESISGEIPLFIGGLDVATNQINLYIGGYLQISGDADLYIGGVVTTSDDIDLYLYGAGTDTQSIDLYIGGYTIASGDNDLFIEGHIVTSGDVDLFINGYEVDSNSVTLFINGHIPASGDDDLFIYGHIFESGSAPLAINQHVRVDSITLVINGAEIPETGISCPILSPAASIQISDSIITVYQSHMDALINQLSRNVILRFQPQRSPCPNCTWDGSRKRSTGVYKQGGPRPFKLGRQCPYCKGIGIIETQSEKCIKCLIKWHPREIENYGISIKRIDSIVRLKTYLTEMDDLMRADSAIVDRDIEGLTKLEVRKIRNPVPMGLREDRYCVSFWELI